MKLLLPFLFVLLLITTTQGQTVSELTHISLPAGAALIPEQDVPDEIGQLREQLFTDPAFTEGTTEVFLWKSASFLKENASKTREQVETSLKNSGWDYQISGTENGVTFFSAVKRLPSRKNIFGYWITASKSLMLVMTEVIVDKSASAAKNSSDTGQTSGPSNSPNAQTFNIPASDLYVNVMGNTMPALPSFPALPKKPGKLRGYVKDASGKPLQGAYIGVRSTAVGGAYSGASGESDAKGYYEILVPWGAAHFYAAGYTIDYGDGRAAVSLHPADGKVSTFPSASGEVENFVLLTYGIADRDRMSERPWDARAYYGGSVRISYNLTSGDMFAAEGSLPLNSEIEITLTGELMDTNTTKTYVVRRKTGGPSNFYYIDNLPVGTYKISARLTNGKALKMRQSRSNIVPMFGLKPTEATGTADLLFIPGGAKAMSGAPNRGNWDAVSIDVLL